MGMVLIYAFAVKLNIFPTGGLVSFHLLGSDWFTLFKSGLQHLVLPLLAYSFIFSGSYAIVLRNSLTSVLSEDYILTAKAKGLDDMQILRGHVIKNAALPAATMITMNLGRIVLGSISVETVFSWPGVGLLVYNAINWRDYPLLQGTMVLFIIIMIVANLIADMLYAFLDPRVRY
jgi:peptide/nickel transport system permease protein